MTDYTKTPGKTAVFLLAAAVFNCGAFLLTSFAYYQTGKWMSALLGVP